MKKRLIEFDRFSDIVQKYWHWGACAAMLAIAVVRHGRSRASVEAPAKIEPEQPAGKPEKWPGEAPPIIKFTEKQPAAVAQDNEARLDWKLFLDKNEIGFPAVPLIDGSEKAAFLKRFAATAIGEQRKFGIPASVSLASGLVQSFAGQRDAAKNGNNFFGLPCSLDPAKTGSGCFEKFGTPWESFRGHSLFVEKIFAGRKKPSTKDRAAWLAKLGATPGYASVRNWQVETTNVIEAFGLAELDSKK